MKTKLEANVKETANRRCLRRVVRHEKLSEKHPSISDTKKLESDLKEAERSSDHYEQKCGELQRKVEQLQKTMREYSALMAVEAINAAYAKNCPHCQKRMKRFHA